MSMETIYIDSLFALNLVVDYFLLLCAARVCGLALRRRRYFLAALFGALWAACSVLPGAEVLSLPLMKLLPAGAMALIAYGCEEKLWRCFIAFLAVSAAFGGAVWGASMLAGEETPGRVYVSLSFRVLVLSFGVCYAAVSLVFRRSAQRAERQTVELALSFRGRSLALTALRDTGNDLHDPVSGRSVAVAEAAALMPLLPGGAAEALALRDAAEVLRLLSVLPDCEGRVSLVPFRAVGSEGALLPALRPDSAAVDGRDALLLVAISPTRLSPDGEYSAII